MALMKCPECGQQVSDKAEFCPHCGIKIAGYVTPVSPNDEGYTSSHKEGPEDNTVLEDRRKRKGYVLPLIVFSVIALIIAGASIYVYKTTQSEREHKDFEYAMHSPDPMVMQMFLSKYAEAPQEHRDSVNNRFRNLTQLQNDWNNAVVSGTRVALEEFLKKHQDSPHRGEALNKIDSIDYEIASRENTIAAYKRYLQIHPDGKYAGQAQSFIDDKKMTELRPEEEAMARAVCRRFFQAINAREENKLLETVTDCLTDFLNRKSASSADVVTFMKKLYKEDVTNLNWHILDDFKAEKVKTEDNTYNIKAVFSAELKMERTDSSKEKYGKYIVTCEILPEGRITRLNMKKL